MSHGQGRPAKRVAVSVADLRRRLGQRLTVDIDVLLPRLEVISSASDPTRPVVGEVVIESIERGVSVRGGVEFGWESECRRCLEPVAGVLPADIDEIFQVGAPEDSDILELVDDRVDLVPLIRDAVLTSLPLAPLCADDCVGPDPERYPTMLATELEGRADTGGRTDPRWSALDELSEELER